MPLRDTPHDFDADGRADLAVWRPAEGTWFWLTSRSGYDPAVGDGKRWGGADRHAAVRRHRWRRQDGSRSCGVRTAGTWFWLTSSTGYDYASQGAKQWGLAGDVPLIGEIDGDGKADLIVWRPGTGTWFWLIVLDRLCLRQSGSKHWGDERSGDVPLLGDFDGDGKADLTVWRVVNGHLVLAAFVGRLRLREPVGAAVGESKSRRRADVGDLDGDGRTDLTVWRATTGTWFWVTSSTGFDYAQQSAKPWGSAAQQDIPMLGDLDGDGRSDLVVWRPGNGIWFWVTSSTMYNSAGTTSMGHIRRHPNDQVAAVVLFALAACTLFAPAAAAQLTRRVYASGFNAPIAFVQDPTDRAVQFVVQQGGRIRVVRNGVVLPTPIPRSDDRGQRPAASRGCSASPSRPTTRPAAAST